MLAGCVGVSPFITYDLFREYFPLIYNLTNPIVSRRKENVEIAHEQNIFSVRPQVNTTSETREDTSIELLGACLHDGNNFRDNLSGLLKALQGC